jgi:ABC-2 type transport system permease protein
MLSLIKIEWLKIKKYPAFWWMVGIVFLTYPGINYMFYYGYQEMTGKPDVMARMLKFALGEPLGFPEAWHSIAFFSSIFVVVPAILVIMLATNEYTYKTHRQNIIDGWSRNEFTTAKLIDVFIVSFVITIVYVLTTLYFALTTNSDNASRWIEQLQYIPLFLLQSFAQLSIAFMLGFLIRKAFIALGIFMFYYLIVENVLIGISKWQKLGFSDYLPFQVSDNLIPPPAFINRFGADAMEYYNKALDAIPYHIVYTLILTAIIWLICYRLNSKKDL